METKAEAGVPEASKDVPGFHHQDLRHPFALGLPLRFEEQIGGKLAYLCSALFPIFLIFQAGIALGAM